MSSKRNRNEWSGYISAKDKQGEASHPRPPTGCLYTLLTCPLLVVVVLAPHPSHGYLVSSSASIRGLLQHLVVARDKESWLVFFPTKEYASVVCRAPQVAAPWVLMKYVPQQSTSGLPNTYAIRGTEKHSETCHSRLRDTSRADIGSEYKVQLR